MEPKELFGLKKKQPWITGSNLDTKRIVVLVVFHLFAYRDRFNSKHLSFCIVRKVWKNLITMKIEKCLGIKAIRI